MFNEFEIKEVIKIDNKVLIYKRGIEIYKKGFEPKVGDFFSLNIEGEYVLTKVELVALKEIFVFKV